jgi:hypothetical protein
MNDASISNALVSEQAASAHKWWSLIACVVAIIAAVHLFPLLNINEPDIAENRVLAGAPEVPRSISDWSVLPAQLDSFAMDRFPLRTYLISGLNYFRYKLGYSGSNKIIVGQNGWLFYDDSTHMAIMSGKLMLDKASIGYWVDGLRQRVEYLKRRDTKFYVMIAPVKEDIYPEHRPKWMPSVRVNTEVDEILNASKAAGYDQIIDPRALMLREKGSQKLYDEYDTHWTGLGAYLGYTQLMTRISKDFLGMYPLPLSAFSPSVLPHAMIPRDLSLMLGISDFVPHDRVSFVKAFPHERNKTTYLSDSHSWMAPQVLHTNANTGKTILLLRDSFTTELLPFLKEHFDTIVMAHVQDGFFRTDLIERFKPDAVVLVVIETGARNSMNVMADLDLK